MILYHKRVLSNWYFSFLTNPQAGSQEDKCQLKLESGPCFGLFYRYGYNSANGRCEQFIFGGCGGNANNFETAQECQEQCGGGVPVSGKDTSMDVLLWWIQNMNVIMNHHMWQLSRWCNSVHVLACYNDAATFFVSKIWHAVPLIMLILWECLRCANLSHFTNLIISGPKMPRQMHFILIVWYLLCIFIHLGVLWEQFRYFTTGLFCLLMLWRQLLHCENVPYFE